MTGRSRLGAKTGALLLAGGLAAGAVVALSGPANAAACSGITGLAGSCTTTGTITIAAGGLTVGAPGSLTWSGAVTGAAQTLYDTATADEVLYASDLRGLLSGNANSGWKITATATTFTGGTTAATLADTVGGQVLAFGGGATAGPAISVPTAACSVALTCTNATTSVSGYPLFIPTGTSATPTKIYNATAGTGLGVIQIGGSAATHPAVWQVNLPPVVTADTYTSTVTVTIAAGPL
jgi:hypothetical protein